MKSSDTDILIVPGHGGSGPNHWQSRMEAKLSTARRVQQDDWSYPSLQKAVENVMAVVEHATRPIVFVTHSAGGALLAHAAVAMVERGVLEKVRGAFIVAPPTPAVLSGLVGMDPAFAEVPRAPLPFPSLLVASSDDPFSTLEDAADMAAAWGAHLVEAGPAGHINAESGHGPWPEGLMRFAGFLSRL